MKNFDINYLLKYLFSLLILILIFDFIGLLSYLLNLWEKIDFLFLSLLISFLLEPLIDCIKIKRRSIQCTIIYCGLIILLFLLFVMVIPVLFEQISLIIQRYHSFYDSMETDFLVNIMDYLDLRSGVSTALASATNAFQNISDFFLCLLASYFISLDLNSIIQLLKKHVKIQQHFELFYKTYQNVFYHYIKGLSLDLIILFCGYLFILWFFKFSYALSFSFLSVMLNLIPYIGPLLAQLLIFVVDLNQEGVIRIELIVFIFIFQQIEANFIQPYIFNKMLKIKPIVTLISILVFGYFLGFIGLIFAPVLAVAIQLAYRSYVFANDKKTVGTWKNVWYNFEEIGEEDK